ncbi:hypothetical protein EP7_000443 [Isosphaeraceae bacterium EP7]
MTPTSKQPVIDPDGIRWIGGAWFGGQLGGTAWMLTAFATYVWQIPWLGLLFLSAFLGINAAGIWIWRNRGRFRFFRSIQLMILVCGGLALLSIAAFDSQPSWGLLHDVEWQGGTLRWREMRRSELRGVYGILLIQVPFMLLLFEVLGRRSRQRGG